MLTGSNDPDKVDYSTVSVGKDITLEGWSGIFIDHNNQKSYGVLVNMNGKINAVDDETGDSGAGIYINGNIQDEHNSPKINLSDTTNIKSTGTGIYAAGYATYNINGAHIEGNESGLGIKSGIFNIKDATIIGTGPDNTPTTGNNNGINSSGAAIQIESNNSYQGNIELNIDSGTFISKKSNVIYEYTVNNSETQVKDINISDGTFTSQSGKAVFSVSNSFKNNHQGFISGGTYSSDPTSYLKSGYSVSQEGNDEYEVVRSTMLELTEEKEETNNNPIIPLIITFSLILLGTILYLNRNKLFK